jgi:citrate lyase subunit beta/citryl-CoA lyase
VSTTGQAGRKGDRVRSDCWISVELKESGGTSVAVKSRVQSMYGASIKKSVEQGLEALGVEHAVVEVVDAGAVPFVIWARLEAAVKAANPLNAGLHQPDGVIIDLEDSVAPSQKKAARYVVRNVLRSVDFLGAERMVRINQGQMGLDDLPFLVPHNVHIILIPKAESADDVKAVDARVQEIRKETRGLHGGHRHAADQRGA